MCSTWTQQYVVCGYCRLYFGAISECLMRIISLYYICREYWIKSDDQDLFYDEANEYCEYEPISHFKLDTQSIFGSLSFNVASLPFTTKILSWKFQ